MNVSLPVTECCAQRKYKCKLASHWVLCHNPPVQVWCVICRNRQLSNDSMLWLLQYSPCSLYCFNNLQILLLPAIYTIWILHLHPQQHTISLCSSILMQCLCQHKCATEFKLFECYCHIIILWRYSHIEMWCPCNVTKSFDWLLSLAEPGFVIRCEDAQSQLQGLFEEEEVLHAFPQIGNLPFCSTY